MFWKLNKQLYQAYKSLLISIAYQMTRSVSDAEDLVHETFLTYNQVSRDKFIENKRSCRKMHRLHLMTAPFSMLDCLF